MMSGGLFLTLTIAVMVGAILGAIAGEKIHSRASPEILRYAYAGVIAIVALRVWITLLWS
jgi:uncharacterized membrane protein YfcA